MNGPNEIRNINHHRSVSALEALQAKAETARLQGHPKADEFKAQADGLAAELSANKPN